MLSDRIGGRRLIGDTKVNQGNQKGQIPLQKNWTMYKSQRNCPFCCRKELTKVEVKQRKFSSCLIEKSEEAGGVVLEEGGPRQWK